MSQGDLQKGIQVSETATERSLRSPGEYRSPEQEQAQKGGDIRPAQDLPLEDINPVNPHLFRENRWQEYFERLRREDPVHFNEIETAGRYWSVTKYDDIKAVSSDWKTFSSAYGITLGFRVGAELPEALRFGTPPFIAQDPPRQTEQRKTVRSAVAPRNLVKLEPLIRERTNRVLDSLPEGDTFDWVDTVSIELTTMMLATLFDFPFEDRRKLTRWSDIVFAIPQPGGLVESQMQKREEMMECLEYFSGLWEERRKQPGHDLVPKGKSRFGGGNGNWGKKRTRPCRIQHRGLPQFASWKEGRGGGQPDLCDQNLFRGRPYPPGGLPARPGHCR